MPSPKGSNGLSYASAGVNLHEKDSFTESLGGLMNHKTFGLRVIENPGGFAGLFRLDYNQRLFADQQGPGGLVACADGVGTKVKLAQQMSVYHTVGIDLVAMNVNDLIVQGAEPLFFLDYIAVPKVQKTMLTDLVRGIVEGCKQSSWRFPGGETAEMPDLYAPGDFDLAGFLRGRRRALSLPSSPIEPAWATSCSGLPPAACIPTATRSSARSSSTPISTSMRFSPNSTSRQARNGQRPPPPLRILRGRCC